ncbi:MAG: MICOS complex subunit MIC26/MIC27 [Polyangiaceae bacterium]|nr:MICOS complex subunit MIC26/MIC27 [Polyangiaceae bacterium]
MNKPSSIRPVQGNLAILLPGLGAVATTAIAGTLLARRGLDHSAPNTMTEVT